MSNNPGDYLNKALDIFITDTGELYTLYGRLPFRFDEINFRQNISPMYELGKKNPARYFPVCPSTIGGTWSARSLNIQYIPKDQTPEDFIKTKLIEEL